jgi:TonB family protein
MSTFLRHIAVMTTLALVTPVFAAEKSKTPADTSTPAANETKATRPVPKFQARPTYPLDMRKKNISGEVVVDFIVTEKGDVINARALRSSHAEFETPAVEAVMKWKFKPATKNGKPVATHMQTPVVFTLNQK